MMHLQMMERGRAFIIALYLLRQQQGVKKARASQRDEDLGTPI
jgi:hypothetical protein